MITLLKKIAGKTAVAAIFAMALVASSAGTSAQIWWGASYSPSFPCGSYGYWSPGISIGSGGVSFNLNVSSGYNPVYYNPAPGYIDPIYYNPPPAYYPAPAPPVVAPPVTPPPRPTYNFPNGNGWSLTPGRLPRGLPSPGRM